LFLPRHSWATILLFYNSCCNWDYEHQPPHSSFLNMQSHRILCLDWPGSVILLKTLTHVSEMSDTCHWAQQFVEMGYCKCFTWAGLVQLS
jgi:hypothetical protein